MSAHKSGCPTKMIDTYQPMQNINPRKTTIQVITRVDADSVILRWAPSTAGGWVIANKIGYVVERIQLEADKDFDPSNYKKLNDSPLKPLSLENWKSSSEKENTFSAIAAQALYGKYFNPRPINVSKAEAYFEQPPRLFIELQDAGYDGSNYNLTYDIQNDVLRGNYYQATYGQTYAVIFMRGTSQ